MATPALSSAEFSHLQPLAARAATRPLVRGPGPAVPAGQQDPRIKAEAHKKKPPGEPGGKFNREALQGTDKHPKDGREDPGRAHRAVCG